MKDSLAVLVGGAGLVEDAVDRPRGSKPRRARYGRAFSTRIDTSLPIGP